MNTHAHSTTTTTPDSPIPQANVPGIAAKGPTHAAYQVREFDGREGKKSFWTRIGSAWSHADGQGFNVQLDCLPLDGRVTLRVASEKKE